MVIAFIHTLFASHVFAAYVTVPDLLTVAPADPVFCNSLTWVDNLIVGTSFSRKYPGLAVHPLAPASDHELAGQGVHDPEFSRLYVLAGHCVHPLDPAALYRPDGQGVHEPAPAALYRPDGQGVHEPAPAALYRPAAQLLHNPFKEYLPARH